LEFDLLALPVEIEEHVGLAAQDIGSIGFWMKSTAPAS
jgi:hypothetical protein